MCVTVVDQNGIWIGDGIGLAAMGWPVEPADLDFPVDEWQPDQCLCGVDVEAILQRHGVPYHLEAGGGFIILGDSP